MSSTVVAALSFPPCPGKHYCKGCENRILSQELNDNQGNRMPTGMSYSLVPKKPSFKEPLARGLKVSLYKHQKGVTLNWLASGHRLRSSNTIDSLIFRGSRSLPLKYSISSDISNGNTGKSSKSDPLTVSYSVQDSSAENLGVGDLEYDSPLDSGGIDRVPEKVNEAGYSGSYIRTNGAPLNGDVVAAKFVESFDGKVAIPGELKNEAVTWWQKFPKRWSIVLLCFFAFLLCNMDRVNMSIAILPMSAEFNWNPSTVGLVQSSFFWGYLLTQIAGGIWADRIGGKWVLGLGVVWWSIATMLTPIAAKIGLPFLLVVRACMGVGEGVAMPAMNNLLSRWVPVKERSRSLAFVYSGMYLGSVIGLAFSPALIQKFNWPSVFFSFGSLGAIWFALWQRYAHSSPSEAPDITEEEMKLIMVDSTTREPVSHIPWMHLLSKAPVWALIVCHFCHNWGTFILLTWMPTYYCQVLKFNLMESGLLSVLPWLTMAIFANVGGWIADTLVSKGISVTTVRKVMQTIGFLGPAFFLTRLSHVTSPAMAVLCMMFSQGSDAFSQSGLYSNHQDIGPRYAGVLLGLSNTAGVLAGVIGTAATGYILQHGSWNDVFKVAVGLYLLGTVIWNLFATGERIFD